MLDLKSRLTAVVSLPGAIRSSDAEVNGVAVSLSGYNSAVAVIATGTITDGTHTVKLEESDDAGSTWSDVASADLSQAFTSIVAANDDEVQIVGYKGKAGTLRITVTDASSSSGGLISGTIILSDEQHAGGSPIIS